MSLQTTEFECPCCSSNSWRPRSYTADISYLECTNCHYYVQQREGDRSAQFEQEQKKFYDDDTLVVTDAFSSLNREITDRRIAVLTKHLTPGSSIVEAGPGDGAVIMKLASLGYSASAVEHSPVLAQRLSGHISVWVGDFAEQDLPAQGFDAYCSFHVIEHVVDFAAHLEAAARCVKPGGLALIATPNSMGWEQRLPFNVALNSDSAHFQLFSKESLEKALKSAGWDLVAVETPSYAIAWLRVITRVLRRVRRQDEHATGGEYARTSSGMFGRVVGVFALLTKPLRALQEHLHGGNELFVIARRVD